MQQSAQSRFTRTADLEVYGLLLLIEDIDHFGGKTLMIYDDEQRVSIKQQPERKNFTN